jgi:hypothetical protein
MKEIRDCLEIQSVSYLNCWTKLKCILILPYLKTTNSNLVSNYHNWWSSSCICLRLWAYISSLVATYFWHCVIFCSLFGTPCAEKIIWLINILFLCLQKKLIYFIYNINNTYQFLLNHFQIVKNIMLNIVLDLQMMKCALRLYSKGRE